MRVKEREQQQKGDLIFKRVPTKQNSGIESANKENSQKEQRKIVKAMSPKMRKQRVCKKVAQIKVTRTYIVDKLEKQGTASSGYLRIKRHKSTAFSGAKGEHFIFALDQIDAEVALSFKLRGDKI